MINKDALDGRFNVFLAPDEGYSDIVKLHDKLYARNLKDSLRLDIQFVPHITIANSKDEHICKKLSDEINYENIDISGQIRHLDILEYEKGNVKTVKLLELR